jgi:fucose 4-O-acetylase-like acetyltransferase
MEKKRIEWLDILKFFGIAAVAFGHIYERQSVTGWLYTFHVPLFFIVGGAVFHPREIFADIKRRTFRILVPYAFFGVLIALYFCFIESRWRDIDMSLTDCLLGLLIGDINHLEFNSHLWFLPCYFLTTIVYNALYRLIKPTACRIVCAVCCIAYMLLGLPSLPWGADRALGFLGLFALGNFAAEKGLLNLADKMKIPMKLSCAAVFLGLSIALYLLNFTSGLMWAVCAVVGTAGFAALSAALEKIPVLPSVGRMTIVILCIHGPIYRILIKLTSMLFGTDTSLLRMNAVICLCITAATLAICCVFYKLFEKLLPQCIGIIPAENKKIKAS